MANKGYHILSLEAKDIYEQELINGVEKGYVLPSKNDRVYFGLFKNVLDYSLDLIELEKCYQKKYRNNRFFFEDEYKNKYTLTIINLKFTYTYKDENNGKDLKQLREHFYKNGFNLGGVHYVRYKRSSGSSRQGKCLFIDEKLLKAMEKWGECGLKPTGDLASWESYKSLSLSSLKGTIDIPLNGILFIQDGPEMLLALSGEFDLHSKTNEPTILTKGEIACKKFENGEKLVCARSPHITMGNLYCATNNLSNNIWDYFDLGENIVCVNAIGENIQQRLNGCDYDSDAMLITNDSLIVKRAFEQKDKFKVPVCSIKSDGKKKPSLAEYRPFYKKI